MADVTIDGKRYALDALSEEAKAQLASLQFVDGKIRELQGQLAVFQTARQAYAEALKAALPEESEQVDSAETQGEA